MIKHSLSRSLFLGLALVPPACSKQPGVNLTSYASRLVEARVAGEGKEFVTGFEGRVMPIDDVILRVLPASPPSKLILRTDIPKGGVLQVAAGIPEDKQAKGAVEFVIGVMENGRNQTVFSVVVDPISRPEHRSYVNIKADLKRFAGPARELVLETRAFDKDGDTFRAFWGAPVISVDPKTKVPADPLVIVYLVDTLRADHTTPYGYGRPTTPKLEMFAKDAVLFEHAIAHASWTKP